MLPLRHSVAKWVTRSSLVSSRLATDLPLAACKKCTPQPKGPDGKVSHHGHREDPLVGGGIPGVRIKGRNGMVDGRHYQCRNGIRSLRVGILG